MEVCISGVPFVPLPVQLPSEVSEMIISMKKDVEAYELYKKNNKKMNEEYKIYYNRELIRKLDKLIFECEVAYENLNYSSNQDYDIYRDRFYNMTEYIYNFQEDNKEQLKEIYNNVVNCVCGDDLCFNTKKPCICDNLIHCDDKYCLCCRSCYCGNQKRVIELASNWANNIIEDY